MTAYDEIFYPGRPFEDTHPDRLAAIGTLFGMHPQPPDRCNVLEVACGDGANLIPMACVLPDSRFTGIDLARRPVERGQAWIRALGLHNVGLHVQDLTHFAAAPASFDYIIAHGLYSWVPLQVRDGLMALIARYLAPQGIAFVSYNIYPGCHVRRMLWDVLKFHTQGIEDPRTCIEEARALARMLATGRTDPERNVLQTEAESLLARDTAYTFHDDLAADNEPLYFHQFIEHAAQHSLQFLSESELGKAGVIGLSADAQGALRSMDAVTREQYLDFLHCRRFRQTLLCHEHVELSRPPRVAQLAALLIGAGGNVSVRSAEGAAAQTELDRERRLLQSILDTLAQAQPRALRLDELKAALATSLENGAPDGEHVAQLVLRAALNGVVQLHAIAPPLVTEAGDRPVASAVARSQNADSDLLTNLMHEVVRVDDPLARRLLALLDGTRGRAQLLVELGAELGDGADARAAQLDSHLHRLGRLGLLSA